MFYFLKLRYVLILLLVCAVGFVRAQSEELKLQYAREAYLEKDYFAAMDYYASLLEKDSKNTEIMMEMARVYMAINDFSKASSFFAKVNKLDKRNKKYPESAYYLALMDKLQGKYTKAASEFDKYYKENIQTNNYFTQRALYEKEACLWADSVSKNITQTIIEPIKHNVNSVYSDFAARNLSDTALLFSSVRPLFQENANSLFDNKYVSSAYIATFNKNDIEPERIYRMNLPEEVDMANGCYSPDGKMFFYSVLNKTKGKAPISKIYYRYKTEEEWSKPKEVPGLDKLDYSYTQPFITIDEEGDYLLFFSSNIPGGFGGMDVFYTKSKDGLQFDVPKNAGETINTLADEYAPFYNANVKQLFYSSDGKKGMGGQDVFVSFKQRDTFTEAQNLGVPINTNFDDLYFTLDKEGKSGYLTSNRKGAKYIKNKYCCYDIFKYRNLPEYVMPIDTQQRRIEIATDTAIIAQIVDTAVVAVKDTQDLKWITDETDNYWYQKNKFDVQQMDTLSVAYKIKKLLPLTLYFHNDEPKKGAAPDKAENDYGYYYNQYIALKELYVKQYVGNETDIEQKKALEADILTFFDEALVGSFDKLTMFFTLVEQELASGKKIKLIVRGYASPLASAEYNEVLSKRRINALVRYMQTWHQGRLAKYMALEDAGLEIVEESIGEQDNNQVSDDINDKRNAIYSPSAASMRNIKILYYEDK